MRKLLVALAGAGLLVGATVTATVAATTSVSDGDVTYVRNHNTSPAWGTSNRIAQCPVGSEPIGGAAYLTRTDVELDYRYDPDPGFNYNGTGWAAMITVPQSGTYTVDVFAICLT